MRTMIIIHRSLVRAGRHHMWLGVARAGYSFKEELPFLLIFVLPATAAVLVRWKLS